VNDRLGRCVYDLALFKDVSPQSDEIVDVYRPEFRIRHLYHREGRPLGPWETCLGHPPNAGQGF
jgi:hypothetical protein